MIGQRELKLEDYLAIARRHRLILIVPALLGAILGYGISLTIPYQYLSQTLVLVKQPAVPDSVVKPIVNEDLNQRLATMKQQILSRTRLEPIIQDFGLYKKDQEKGLPMEELVARLRKTITVTLVESMTETRNQVPGFTVAVVSDNPRLAQQICTQITSMFIEESEKTLETSAANTTDFISRQVTQAKVKLDEQDAKLATFKRQFMGSLPEDEAANLNLLNGLNTQLEATTQALSRAQQEKAFAESMLSQQLAAWQSTASEKSPLTLEMQLSDLQNQLVSMEARYTEDYPDVIKLKNNITQLKKKIADTHASDSQKPSAPKDAIEPPNIQQLRAQIHQNDLVIKDKTVQEEQIQNQIRTYQGRISLSPSVEQQYKELTRDYQTSSDNYNDLLKKQTASQMGKDLQTQQQGEQFTVLDPASLPESPTYPDHGLFGMGGLAAGLMIGVGIVLVIEMRDNTLRTERDVEFFLKVPTLAMVPALELQGGPAYGPGGGNGKNGKGFGNGKGTKYKDPDSVARPSLRERVGMRS
jgi:polysaccharide chain length determinant protein (PEP-CTERM system associated)